MYKLIKALLLCSALTCFVANSQSRIKADIPPLPEAVTNNAVTKVTTPTAKFLISFNGLGQEKDYRAVHNKAYLLKVGDKNWQAIDPVPIQQPITGLVGRLASVATSIGDNAYVFGGYTVAKDHAEISVPDVYRFNVSTKQYTLLSPMPVPVDDSIAFTYRDRYIYLVSGWHNDGNVNLVQVYDTQTDTWQQASPFPGKPVFGHAGGIVDDTLVVCDGVRVDVHLAKRRSYASEVACYVGKISSKNPFEIDWRKLAHPTGKARYRMAAIGSKTNSSTVFAGGSDNPYNYNGIGYNGEPSKPSNEVWIYDLKKKAWFIQTSAKATMDHRALIELKQQFITIGGMLKSQEVTPQVNIHNLSN